VTYGAIALVKWMTITIAQQMDFRGKTAAGSA
jgi:hypothetical protein